MGNIANTIEAAIRNEREAGGKIQTIARKHDIPDGYLSRLLSGKRGFGGLTVATLERMFPNATISLDGGGVSVSNSINSGQNIHVSAGRCDIDAYRGRLVMALADRLPAEWLAKAIEAVKLTEV